MEDIVIKITIPESEYKNWRGDKETMKQELLIDVREYFDSLGVNDFEIEIN